VSPGIGDQLLDTPQKGVRPRCVQRAKCLGQDELNIEIDRSLRQRQQCRVQVHGQDAHLPHDLAHFGQQLAGDVARLDEMGR
jgi:hypothetical protein